MSLSCLIEPNSDLKQLLNQNEELAPYFPPEYIDDFDMGQPLYGYIGQLKLKKIFYLALLHDRLQTLRDPTNIPTLMPFSLRQQAADFLHRLIGDPPINREVFDLWWINDGMGMASSHPKIHYRTAFIRLPVTSFEAIYEPEPPLAGWLADIIEYKRAR